MRATDTMRSEEAGGDRPVAGWALALALDCEHLAVPPAARLSLRRVTEVEIGRGAQRAVHHAGGRLRIDLSDRWSSQVHARLARAGEGSSGVGTGSPPGVWKFDISPRELTVTRSQGRPTVPWIAWKASGGFLSRVLSYSK